MLFLYLFLLLQFYIQTKFYPNTTVGGIDVSGMTLTEAKEAVETDLKNHVLVINGRNKAKYELKGKDIDLSAKYEDQLESCFKKNTRSFSFYKIMTGEDFDVAFDVSYNKDLLVQNLSQSFLVAGEIDIKLQHHKVHM